MARLVVGGRCRLLAWLISARCVSMESFPRHVGALNAADLLAGA